MKNIILKFFLIILTFSIANFGQEIKSFPKSAKILEMQAVTANRKMILWMPNPVKNPHDKMLEGEEYNCPDETRGSYYSGKVFVTLIDSGTNKTINNLEIKGDGEGNFPDEIDIPYAIRSGYYYNVRNPSKTIERKPQIMALKDYNGDGKPQEFALFDALFCMGLKTTLIGYDERQDKVIQYPIQLMTDGKTKTIYWSDYLFSKKPLQKGVWNYKIDYRGRGGTLDKYKIRYDRNKKIFIGKLTSTDSAND